MNIALRARCAQLVFADYRFDRPDRERAVALARQGVGGFCLFYGERRAVPALVNELQAEATTPLLFASDYEHGCGHQVEGATLFPPNMALGATGSEDLAHLKGRATGREARAMGVPWVLAPVLDVNANPENPIINTRSFGQDTHLVTRLARAFTAGLHEAGALACGKHFPGHGDVTADSHLELPVLEHSLYRLRETELGPYRDLGRELDSVMTAHLVVKAVDGERPASLSRAVTDGLLRRELGYEGLVTTDALMMGGITRFCPEPEAIELAVNAGADVLLYPLDPEAAIAHLEASVRAGRIAESRIDEAGARIAAMKARAAIPARVDEASVLVGCEEHRTAAQRIADAAITLVHGSGRVTGPVAHRRIADASARGDLGVFERELTRSVRRDDAAPVCVVSVFFKQKAFAGKTGLDEALVEQVRAARREYRSVVVVSFGSPYVIRHFPLVSSYVCAYGEDEFSQRAAARALTGAIPFDGKLPVKLED
jgi:beta-glucosidase-like glycosyl hydrolase